jgi:hypothetical protein
MALGSRKNENSFVTKRGREKERAPFFGGGNSVTQKRFFVAPFVYWWAKL